jgi:hypothetical protein
LGPLLAILAFTATVLGIGVLWHQRFTPPTKIFDSENARYWVDRSDVIHDLIASGVLYRVDTESYGVSVIVGARFSEIPYDDKVSAAKVIQGTVGIGNGGDHFLLYDWRTNRKVGAWRGTEGLVLFNDR